MQRSTSIFAGLLLLLLLLTISACVTTAPLLKPDGSPDGQAIFENRCNQCHALPSPRSWSDRDWARQVSHYGPRAGIRPEWREAVISYLQEANNASSAPRTESR